MVFGAYDVTGGDGANNTAPARRMNKLWRAYSYTKKLERETGIEPATFSLGS
jgi:hypothetical protein